MKRFLMTSALVLTTATGAAFAQSNDSSSQLRTQVAQDPNNVAPQDK